MTQLGYISSCSMNKFRIWTQYYFSIIHSYQKGPAGEVLRRHEKVNEQMHVAGWVKLLAHGVKKTFGRRVKERTGGQKGERGDGMEGGMYIVSECSLQTPA